MDEHLGHFRIDGVGGVISNMDVLRVEELPDCECTPIIGENIDCLNRGSAVASPHDVNLDGHHGCCFEL